MSAQNKLFIVLAAVLFVITILTGIWTSHAGKPYPAALTAIHKLICIGTSVFAVLFIISMLKQVSATAIIFALIAIAIISLFALLATGGIMSSGNVRTILKIIHTSATGTFAVSSALTFTLLISKLKL